MSCKEAEPVDIITSSDKDEIIGYRTMPKLTASPASPGTELEHELIPSESPISPYISVNPGRMHGEPCFKGSRVPVQTLFDYLSAGDTLDEFLEGFAPVSREQAQAVLNLASMGLLQGLRLL